MKRVIISAAFDDLRSANLRFLQESAGLGRVEVFLWSDEKIKKVTGGQPTFPLAERKYFLEALKFVDQVNILDCDLNDSDLIKNTPDSQTILVVHEATDTLEKRVWCDRKDFGYHVMAASNLEGFPEPDEYAGKTRSGRKRVIVTGCYDWFHSGHIRFFEEVSDLGELHVVVGHDLNIQHLKGEGHPMYKEDERRYMAASNRFVERAYISSGKGWLDAEPEMKIIRPDIYAVNEDGDRPEKKEFCDAHGIGYHVLKRLPKKGLPKRQSTDLRGF